MLTHNLYFISYYLNFDDLYFKCSLLNLILFLCGGRIYFLPHLFCPQSFIFPLPCNLPPNKRKPLKTQLFVPCHYIIGRFLLLYQFELLRFSFNAHKRPTIVLFCHGLTTAHQAKENPLKRFYLHFKGIYYFDGYYYLFFNPTNILLNACLFSFNVTSGVLNTFLSVRVSMPISLNFLL